MYCSDQWVVDGGDVAIHVSIFSTQPQDIVVDKVSHSIGGTDLNVYLAVPLNRVVCLWRTQHSSILFPLADSL